jgi:hypothetical protein
MFAVLQTFDVVDYCQYCHVAPALNILQVRLIQHIMCLDAFTFQVPTVIIND